MSEDSSDHSEEIESISSYYGSDFNECTNEIVAETGLKYEIWVRKDQEWSASLQFSLPDEYPSKPPVFELCSTWMTDADEEEVNERFGKKLEQHGGLAVGLLDAWVEILREFVDQKAITEQENKMEITQNQEDEPGPADEEEEHVEEEQQNVESVCPEIIHGEEPITDRKSTFLAHFAVITSKNQVEQVLSKLKEDRKVAKATYNIWAYRIFDDKKNSYIEGNDDDGESAAGGRLLHLLQTSDAKDVIVIVTRWHGHTELGPERFKHINDCAKKLLQDKGIIESKTSTDSKETKGKAKSKAKKH